MMQILANALTSAPRAMFCFCSPPNAVMQKKPATVSIFGRDSVGRSCPPGLQHQGWSFRLAHMEGVGHIWSDFTGSIAPSRRR